jgi:hypothetical protein
MPRSNRLLVLVMLLLAAPGLAWGQDRAVQFTIADSYPGLSSPLGARGRLYVMLAYRSDRPVRFRMEGFAAGQKVTGASSNIAPPYPAGDGEAMVWIAYAQPTTIDEIRIGAFDERWQPLASVTTPAPLEWSAAAARNPRPRPEWAERLDKEQQEKARKANAKINAEHTEFGILVVGIGAYSILGYLILQPLLAFRFSGAWRIAALVPLIPMMLLFIFTAAMLREGSNLWPLFLIMYAPLAFLYLLIIAAMRWVVVRLARS